MFEKDVDKLGITVNFIFEIARFSIRLAHLVVCIVDGSFGLI
jgi:hypothetical protein